MRPPLRLSSLVVALLCALAWLFSPNARAASPLADFDAARAQALREAIARVLVEEQVAGVGVALVDREGARFVAGVGEADVARGRPVTADTLFRVGSITKSFVALAIVTQVERGALRLDDRVAALLPGVAIDNAWEDEAPITVAHLLEHTAGFDDMRFNETFGGPECELLPLDAVLARNPRSRQARWRPGTRFAYANPGYTVAARALEEVTGEPYEQTVTRELLAPLGMDGAALRQGPGVQGRLAVGYVAPGEAVEYQCILHRPAGSLMASPRDLAELVRFWINRGEVEGRPLISRASVERIERSGTLPALGLDTDYGLGNYGDVRGPAR
ncbi:MAG: beta-lactamase family protein, partial [Myxococcales bacterium]|nr:beta-lactamase family protein [Myxococcales bacterium]